MNTTEAVEREMFERWAKIHGWKISPWMESDGCYQSDQSRGMWAAWLARANLLGTVQP